MDQFLSNRGSGGLWDRHPGTGRGAGWVVACLAGLGTWVLAAPVSGAGVDAPDAALAEHPGAAVYRELCLDCHGERGQGVPGKADDPLYGNRTLKSLAGRIERTMPEDDEDACVGEEAEAVAAYIYDAFYSLEARLRNNPAKRDLARLTVDQYRVSVADIVRELRGEPVPAVAGGGGLKARYFGNRGFRGDREKDGADTAERVDAEVRFDFGSGSPFPEKFGAEEFSVRWEGSIVAEETGLYQFVVRTQNGVRLWVNQRGDGRGRSSEIALIDGWVSSGSEPRDEEASVFLLGGRSYPVRLDFFKYKDKTASVEFLWKPPHGGLATVPVEALSPEGSSDTMVVASPFPPDDRSLGYERGTAVSREWYAAVTESASEVAGYLDTHLDRLTGTRPDRPERAEKVRELAVGFAELAFRRPYSETGREAFLETHFGRAAGDGGGSNADLQAALKRAVLFTLLSPRFLYPELPETIAAPAGSGGIGEAPPDGFTVASRLALALWDSVPDRPLLEAAGRGELAGRDQVRKHAQRMLADPRTRAKLRGFFHEWLELGRGDELSKDTEEFPGFGAAVVADLRTSLYRFLDSVVWEGSSDYRELLLSQDLFLNDRLAAIYGGGAPGGAPVFGPPQPGFQKVTAAGGKRAGVLTHPYLMSALAYHDNTSPIHRGVFLTRNIIGMTLKPPPEATEFVDSSFDPSFTMREKVTELTRNDTCMACHTTINPLGFSFEHYDAIGRWRAVDNGKPIDATSEFHRDTGETIPLQGPWDVASLAASSPSAHDAFIRNLFHHAVKQTLPAYGSGVAEALRDGFDASGFNIKTLLAEVATTAAAHGLGPAPEPAAPRRQVARR